MHNIAIVYGRAVKNAQARTVPSVAAYLMEVWAGTGTGHHSPSA